MKGNMFPMIRKKDLKQTLRWEKIYIKIYIFDEPLILNTAVYNNANFFLLCSGTLDCWKKILKDEGSKAFFKVIPNLIITYA